MFGFIIFIIIFVVILTVFAEGFKAYRACQWKGRMEMAYRLLAENIPDIKSIDETVKILNTDNREESRELVRRLMQKRDSLPQPVVVPLSEEEAKAELLKTADNEFKERLRHHGINPP